MKRSNLWMRFGSNAGRSVTLALAGLLIPIGPISATVFTDRTAFNTAASGLGTIVTEGYETYPVGTLSGARTLNLNGFRVSYAPGDAGNSGFGIINLSG